MTDSSVTNVDTSGEKCICTVSTKKGDKIVEADIVLSAVGVQTNLDGLGLENIGISNEKGKINVDEYYRTNVEGIYAIGDIVHGPALAHKASHEAIICVEKICGLEPKPMNYNNIPGCTYITPEVASVGLTEAKALAAGYQIKVGKFPFTASGKASAAGNKDGFIKVISMLRTDNGSVVTWLETTLPRWWRQQYWHASWGLPVVTSLKTFSLILPCPKLSWKLLPQHTEK